jgi:membrane protease YdiL (CAAX protease family)
MIIIISVYGVLFGLLAAWRKSLRPGMIAHFLQDGVGGLLLAARVLR